MFLLSENLDRVPDLRNFVAYEIAIMVFIFGMVFLSVLYPTTMKGLYY